MRITKKYILISGGIIINTEARKMYCAFSGCVGKEIKVSSYHQGKDYVWLMRWRVEKVLRQSNSQDKLRKYWESLSKTEARYYQPIE